MSGILGFNNLSIDESAIQAEYERQARQASPEIELEYRLLLAKSLGARAVQGEEFDTYGFMAIGFPIFTPDDDAHKDIVDAIENIRAIPGGAKITVGKDGSYDQATCEKSTEAPGVRLVPLQNEDGYSVRAEVLCERVLYSHEYGKIRMANNEPLRVSFIDASFKQVLIRPVKAHNHGVR